MDNILISIADDFSKTPGSRYREEGEFSGEEFLEEILEPSFVKARAEGKQLVVDLDRTVGYGTSFLEEVFGGLARKYGAEEVKSHLSIISEEERYLKEDIEEYISDAGRKG